MSMLTWCQLYRHTDRVMKHSLSIMSNSSQTSRLHECEICHGEVIVVRNMNEFKGVIFCFLSFRWLYGCFCTCKANLEAQVHNKESLTIWQKTLAFIFVTYLRHYATQHHLQLEDCPPPRWRSRPPQFLQSVYEDVEITSKEDIFC